MKTTFIGFLFLVAPYINAQEKIRTFQLSDAPRYSEETGYGYDLTDTPEKGSKAPFFFSVRVPDGNYQVTVRLGNKKQAGVTTVRGESRRLFIDNLATQKGQFVDETFIINKRNPRISEKESVRIKPREKAKLNWDDKLTLEFNGDAPKGAYYSFMTSLKTFIDEARARGAYPVLVTPTQRRSFDATGHIRDTHEDYPEAMRWLAAKENVPLIDLNEMTRTLYEALGTETSKRAFVHYPAGAYPGQKQDFADNTHFNPYGAYQIAQCVIEGMKKAVPNLAKHLKIDPAYNPAYPDNPDTFHWNNSPFTEIEKPDGN